jgi:uncharacterized protein (TIRG00374 family)
MKKKWKVIVNIITLLALVLTIVLVRKDVGHSLHDLGNINTYALLLMIPIQIINYHSYTKLYQSFLKILHKKVDYKFLLRVSLELNFVNHVFPSGGVSGFSYFSLRLKQRGVSTAKATFCQMMRFALTFITYLGLLFLGLLLLAVRGGASNLTILITCSLAFLVLFVTLVGIYIIGSRERINYFTQGLAKFLNYLIHFIRRKHPETINLERVKKTFDELHDNYMILKDNLPQLKLPALYSLSANVTEILTVYVVYVAYGSYVNIGAVIIAYALANFAGLIAVLPGGVGVYETLMTLVMVSAGVPAGLAISVTIMYRVLNMLLSLPVGYFLYHKALSNINVEDIRGTDAAV